MKKSLIVLTASIALLATPMMAEEAVTVSTAGPAPMKGPTGLLALIAAATAVAILAEANSGNGT